MFALMVLSVVSAYSDDLYIEDYDLSVNYNSAIADDVFTLTLTITNDASSAKNFTFEFDDDKPFDFLTDESWSFYLESGNTTSKDFRVKVDDDAESKNYDLEFDLDDGSGDWDDSFDIKITSNSADISVGEIVSSPSRILPGADDVSFSVTIKNKGSFDAEDLVATLILPNGFEASSSYSNIFHAGDLNSGDSSTLTFYFDVEENVLESSVAEIELSYEADGNEETANIEIEIPVFPTPQFEIVAVENVGDIFPGSTSKIKISIKNVGGEDAKDVTLKIYERSDQPFVFDEKSVYVGSLNSGETGEAVFEFQVDKNAEIISYILDFQTRCISGDSVVVGDLSTKIFVSEKEINIQNYLIYVFGALIIILGFLVFLSRRK